MSHPYSDLPDRQFWKREPALRHPGQLDPGFPVPFRIAASDRIVTAGSCFAQHLARQLAPFGLNHFVTEPAHPIIPSIIGEKHNYGLFSARYGNIYTPVSFCSSLNVRSAGFSHRRWLGAPHRERAWSILFDRRSNRAASALPRKLPLIGGIIWHACAVPLPKWMSLFLP
jgi:GSCFA family